MHLGSPIGLYGAERWILALVRFLPTDSVSSIVGVIQDEPTAGTAPICAEAEARGHESVQFEAKGRLSWAAVRQIRKFVTDNDIDIVHTHGYKTDIIGLLATRGTSCRTVATPHGWSTTAGLKLQVYETLDRLAFSFIDAVVPLSEDLYAGLARMPWLRKRLFLIENGVDLSEIEAAQATRDPALRVSDDTFVFGYIGQLISRKRIETLIRAFDEIDAKPRELWIVGSGPQQTELEQIAQECHTNSRIRFLGFREDRLELLKRFNAFVLPSSLEGIPRCVMEALGAGKAVIASDIPGCTDLIEHGRTGLLYQCGDESDLREQMRRLMDDPTLGDRLAASGNALVKERFSAEVMGRHYARLYERLIRQGSRVSISTQ